jgi:hypothetical protein
MTIYSGFTYYRWWFSIVMLNYQRVHYESFLSPCRHCLHERSTMRHCQKICYCHKLFYIQKASQNQWRNVHRFALALSSPKKIQQLISYLTLSHPVYRCGFWCLWQQGWVVPSTPRLSLSADSSKATMSKRSRTWTSRSAGPSCIVKRTALTQPRSRFHSIILYLKSKISTFHHVQITTNQDSRILKVIQGACWNDTTTRWSSFWYCMILLASLQTPVKHPACSSCWR